MSRTSFANIDSTTNRVASAVAQARQMVLTANCIASGQAFCLPQPYTYHPATYETTNQAWVHDTVIQYYTSINTSACTLTSSQQAFYAYLQGKQNTCPANTFYLFEAILRIIRMAATSVALLLAAIGSFVVKMLAAPFSKTAQESMINQWVSMKKMFKSFFSQASDMTVDMFMNSGKLSYFGWETFCILVHAYIFYFVLQTQDHWA